MEKEGFQVDIANSEKRNTKAGASGNWSIEYKIYHTVDQASAQD